MALLLLALLAICIGGLASLGGGLQLRAFEQQMNDGNTGAGGYDTSLVAQSFRSPRPNLSRIRIQLSSFTGLPSSGRVRLLSGDGLSGPTLYEAPLSTAIFTQTNPYLTIDFPPIANSEGVTYTLALDTPGRPLRSVIGIKYNSFDALSSGSMYTDDGRQPGDIAFVAYYRYDLGTLAGDVARTLGGQWVLLAVWAALLWLPGLALLVWLPNGLSAGQRLLAAPGVGLLSLPIFFMLTRALGLRVGSAVMWLVILLCAAALVLWAFRARPHPRFGSTSKADVAFWIGLAATFVLTLAARLISLRDALAGMGLDAYHHTLIAEMFVRAGGIPSNYEPYAPLSSFTYHYGFHALVASVGWLAGRTSPTDLMVLMPQAGQVVDALPVLTLTFFGWKALGNRWIGLLAGLLAGLVSIFPAFYFNWSRYTQGLGLALLPVAWILLLEALDYSPPLASNSTAAGGITWQSALRQSGPYMLAVIGAVGLALSHYRIEIIYAAFVALYLGWSVMAAVRAHKSGREVFRPALRTGIVGALSLAALSPWLINLAQNFSTHFVNRNSPVTSPYYDLSNTLGTDLLSHFSIPLMLALSGLGLMIFGWKAVDNRRLGLSIGALAMLLALYAYYSALLGLVQLPTAWTLLLEIALLAWLAWSAGRREAALLLPMLTWLALAAWSSPFIFPVRLPYSGYLDITTVASSAWLPMSLLSGYALVELATWGLSLADAYPGVRRRLWRVAAPALAVPALLLGGSASGFSLSAMIDSKPYIAPADEQALIWMRDNLPKDAYVLANPFAFPWDPPPQSVQGSDAGLWVPLITDGIRVSVPPVPAYNERLADPSYLSNIREIIAYEPFADQPANWDQLKVLGVTYIFVGSRGGALSVSDLLKSDRVRVVFHQDEAWVFEIK